MAILLAILALLAVPAAATAAKKGATKKGGAKVGALDRAFSRDGKVVTVFPKVRGRAPANYRLPYEFAAGRVAMAGGPGGSLVVANTKAVMRFLPNGRRDPGFGGNGSVPIPETEGVRFQLADVAVDSQGRVLVAGTSRAADGIGMSDQRLPGPLPSAATIRRYGPDGQLDPTFGAGGVLTSHLGAPSPTLDGAPYEEPAVAVVGLTVDSSDRPIVTGSTVAEVGLCGASQIRYERSQAFVARLAAVGGGPDTTFGVGGRTAVAGLSWLGLPTPTAGGLFSVGAAVDPCRNDEAPDEPSVVSSFSDAGLNSAFSADGLWSRPFLRVSDVAPAPKGRIALLVRTIELRGGEWVESAGRVMRLRRNGTIDRSFGKAGEAAMKLPRRSSLAAIGTDRKGRVLMAGTIEGIFGPKDKRRGRLDFLLMRTTAGGQADRRFGRSGRVITKFGGRANVRATELLVDRANRITVGGKFAGPSSDEAFALARYKGGP